MRKVSGVACKSLCLFLWAGLTACLLPGCGPRYHCEPNPPYGISTPPAVTLAAGDVVEVRFFYTPELNVTQTVRPDGKISLQLIGDVAVQGKAPAELRQDLLARYASQLKAPDVAVIVQSFYQRRVYVGGEVLRAGVVQMPGSLTALDAIMEAGGFRLPQAEVKNVIVIRYRDDHRYGYCLDLKAALRGGELRPFYLEPQDIVYVPQTRITDIGQWVDQYINSLLPRTGFVMLTDVGGTTIGYDLR
jgi:polysaccharide export outer membrane protein